jgi:hypothetical protein
MGPRAAPATPPREAPPNEPSSQEYWDSSEEEKEAKRSRKF